LYTEPARRYLVAAAAGQSYYWNVIALNAAMVAAAAAASMSRILTVEERDHLESLPASRRISSGHC